MSQITVNINKPEDIVVPDTDGTDSTDVIVTPSTGTVGTDSYGNNMATPIIGGVAIVLLVTMLIAVATIVNHRKAKKAEETSSSESSKRSLRIVIGFVLLLSFTTVFGYLKSNDSHFSARADSAQEDSLSITVNDVDINIEVSDSPVYAMATSAVTVNTATEAGYTLSAYVENADLVAENTTQKISSLTSSESATKLADNTWGVALTNPTDQNSEVFFGLPTSASNPMTIKETTAATSVGDTSTLYYATYVTPDLDCGTYTGATIHYIAVANPSTLYMQDVASWKNDLEVDSPIEVIDRRDGKSYIVSKLADGRIWMMQNLDLDLDADTTYTNEDTDLGYNASTKEYETASWQPSDSTALDVDGWIVSDFAPASYDPGDLYWNGTESGWSDWEAYYNECSWDNESDRYECNESLNPISTYVESSGIPQLHLGNYYNWSAAIAVNDSSIYSGSDYVNQSICPVGWTLPDQNTFFNMWGKYGFTTSAINGENKLWESPLYFVASGNYDTILAYVGSDGGYYSPVADDTKWAVGVDFGVDGYLDTVWGRRYVGHSIRCIAR